LFWFLVPRQAEGPASPETADVVARTPDPAVLLAEKRLPVSAKGVSTDAATTASPPAAVQPPAKSVPARQLPLVFHPAGEKIRIFFDEAEAEPPPSAEPLLDAIAAQYRSLARGGATVRLTVTGHSDGRWGELDYTSGKRAEAVRNKLIARGIPARALRTQNLSNRQPLATTEDDPQNRRVEVSFSVARPS
jgi:outer membrane protein OmpA-like peptidoglycan-associated protein